MMQEAPNTGRLHGSPQRVVLNAEDWHKGQRLLQWLNHSVGDFLEKNPNIQMHKRLDAQGLLANMERAFQEYNNWLIGHRSE